MSWILSSNTCFSLPRCLFFNTIIIMIQVLELLKNGVSKDPKHLNASSDRTYPMGLLQLNAMRLADIFSDDSNFRSYITVYFVSYYDHTSEFVPLISFLSCFSEIAISLLLRLYFPKSIIAITSLLSELT